MSSLKEKKEFNEHLRKVFNTYQPIDEKIIKREHPKLHAQGLELYGSWRRAIKENGISKRKMIENQKFFLYSIMKRRYEKHGEEALRPKNIDNETKEMIVNSFKTMKKLKAAIISWNRDKIMFEIREMALTGSNVDDLEKGNPGLYQHAMTYFKDMKSLKEEYKKDFVIRVIDENERTEIKTEAKPVILKPEKRRGRPKKINVKPSFEQSEVVQFFFDIAKSHGGFEGINLEEAVQIHEISKEEIIQFILEKGAESRKKGKILTEENIKADDPVMYHALKLRFGNLKTAFNEAAKSLLG